jgi:hypothetical protein
LVVIAAPPPDHQPSPLFFNLSAGTKLIRIFDPTKYGTSALTWRYFGPLHRFDHQRSEFSHPQIDDERGIYYAALTLSSCVVECFGDSGSIVIEEQCVASIEVTRSLRLLDLRRNGAMKAGSVAALAKTADRELSQAWSRYFYEQEEIYGKIDGIIYFNAHNDEDAVAFYERAKNAFSCSEKQIIKLDDAQLRPYLQEIALAHNLLFIPYLAL